MRTDTPAVFWESGHMSVSPSNLQWSEQELTNFFEHAPIGLHWLGPDGRILWANQTELDMLGYTREEYVGHPIYDFHIDQQVPQNMLQRLARGETLQNYEARLRAKDGSIKYVLINSNVRWEDGRFVHTRSFTRDISVWKRAEAALWQLTAIVESSDDAIIGKDLDGIILTWNAGAEHLYGYTAAEVIGRPITLLLPPDRPDEVTHILDQLKRGQRIEHFETVRVRKGGRHVMVSLTIFPIRDASGTPIGASTIARDLTRHKQIEVQLIHAQKMECIGRLTCGIAHDFNNLLTVIRGHAELALESLESDNLLRADMQAIQARSRSP